MKIYIVYFQRYPEDKVTERPFTEKGEANRFLDAKLEDYRYTVGRAWMKTFDVGGSNR